MKKPTGSESFCETMLRGTMGRAVKSLAKSMAETNEEQGFVICRKDVGTLLPSRICKGTSCAVMLSDCGGMKDIGTFHTHPGRTSRYGNFSYNDFSSNIFGEGEKMCITYINQNNAPELRCTDTPFVHRPNDSPKITSSYKARMHELAEAEETFDLQDKIGFEKMKESTPKERGEIIKQIDDLENIVREKSRVLEQNTCIVEIK